MKYYLIAGEASGDLHASNLMKELKKRDPLAQFRCWGGDLMQREGGVLVKHYRDLAFMGFIEVLFNLRTIFSNMRFCRKDLLEFAPDVLILVDYPGFNLRIARFAHENGIRIFYYISPQLWAWKASRVRIVRENVDQMFVILPFEKEFYSRYNYNVDFVGHPLLDVINAQQSYQDAAEFREKNALGDKPLVALLPGSRKQEIRKVLGIMLQMTSAFPEFQFVIAGAPSMPREFYQSVTGTEPVLFVKGQTYDLLRNSEAALVTSGTATLETALMGIPQVVCYKGSIFSYLLARMVVHVKYISLVNLIMDRTVVTELIQNDFTSERLEQELRAITEDALNRERMLEAYKELREKLGGQGASAKAAELMIRSMKPGKINETK